MHDEFWNLLPTYKNINRIKFNKLPDSQVYLNNMINQQYIAFTAIMGQQGNPRLKEEYLTVFPRMKELGTCGGLITTNEFANAMENAINPLYQIAKNQFFFVWRYGL